MDLADSHCHSGAGWPAARLLPACVLLMCLTAGEAKAPPANYHPAELYHGAVPARNKTASVSEAVNKNRLRAEPPQLKQEESVLVLANKTY